MPGRGRGHGVSVLATLTAPGTNAVPPASSAVRPARTPGQIRIGSAVAVTGHARHRDGATATVVGHTRAFVRVAFGGAPEHALVQEDVVRIRPRFLVVRVEPQCLAAERAAAGGGAVPPVRAAPTRPAATPERRAAAAKAGPAGRMPAGAGPRSGYVTDDASDGEEADDDDASAWGADRDAEVPAVAPAGGSDGRLCVGGGISDDEATDDEGAGDEGASFVACGPDRGGDLLAATPASGSNGWGYVTDGATDDEDADEEDADGEESWTASREDHGAEVPAVTPTRDARRGVSKETHLLVAGLLRRAARAERARDALRRRVRCPTCLEVKEEMYARPCGHRTCFDCFVRTGTQCPNRCAAARERDAPIKRLYE